MYGRCEIFNGIMCYDIKMRMQSHFLKLNDDKTELLLVHSKYRQMPPLLPVVFGNEMIMPTECVSFS